MGSKIGVEYERLTCKPDGSITNEGVLLVKHPYKEAKYVDEGSQAQFEWNSQPHRRIKDLTEEYLRQEDALADLCAEYGVFGLPASENGAGERGRINLHEKSRASAYRAIFGEGTPEKLFPWAGIHCHIDANQPRLVEQFNALTALALVSAAFSSTSTINYEGKNGINCQRQKALQKDVFAKIPEERGYIGSKDELAARDVRRWENWKNAYVDAGLEAAEFAHKFKLDNTGYADIRHRPEIGSGTFELRVYDSAPADILMGIAALIQGFNDRILDQNIPVTIARKDDDYLFHGRIVVLPNWKTLQSLSELQIKSGLEDERIRDYLGQIAEFAGRQLDRQDAHYLKPLEAMIDSGENTSTQLTAHLQMQGCSAKEEGRYKPEALKTANRFIRYKQQEAVERLRHAA